MPGSNKPRSQLTLGAFSAFIKVDNKKLPIYHVEETADSATCWIASEAGKPFSILWRNSDASFESKTQIFIDGVRLTKVWHSQLKRLNNPDSWDYKDGYRTSETTRRPFMFSEIQTTDDDTYLERPISSQFGTITLKLTEVRVLETFHSRRFIHDDELPDKIHERSKKGMGHQVRLGDEVPCKRARPMSRCTKDIRDIATLTFRYRPREWLQAEGIIEPANLGQEQTRNDANDRQRETLLTSGNTHHRSRPTHPKEALAGSRSAANLQKPSISTSTLPRPNCNASSETMRSITSDTGPHAEDDGQEDPTYQRILQLEAELERVKRDYKEGRNSKIKKSNNAASDASRPVVKREIVKQESSSMVIDLTEVDSD